VDGYAITGMVLFFVTLLVLSWILLRSRKIKVKLADQELKLAARIVKLRNITLICGMFAISAFFMLLSRISPPSPGTAAYVVRDTWSTVFLYTGLTMFAIAACLGYLSRKIDFSRLLRIHAVKEKMRAGLKFNSRRKSKLKRKNRV
jgi:hypothetical protein